MEQFRDAVCEKCGKTFQVGRGQNGNWLRRRFCPDCSITNQKYKDVICKKCGKVFKVGRTSDSRRFIKRDICDDCLKLPETKTLICQKCGKPFTVQRSKTTNNFLLRKYCFDCDTAGKDYRIAHCVTCGKEFKQYRSPYGGFSEKKYCSYECSLIQRKTKICSVCGKEFELERSETTGNFKDNGKYCSKECAKIGWEQLTKKTCQEKYGVDYPCQSEKCVEANPTIHSNVNENFGKLLKKNNIDYVDDFKLGRYFYDFHILNTNILIEINPTFTHTSIETGVYPALAKNYHHDKTKFALDNGYICICVWDWDIWKDIIKLLQNSNINLQETSVQLHYSKNKENIISYEENNKYLEQGYLPIYDDGFKVIV